MQRIILATDSPDPSGLGEHMLTLGTALSSDYDILIAAPEGEPSARLLDKAARRGLRVKTLPVDRPAELRHWMASYRPDLVHVHAGIGWEGHALVRMAAAAGAPVVRTEHLPYLLTDVVQQAEYRAMLLSVDARIAVSRAVAASHANMGRGPIHTVPNGIVAPKSRIARHAVRGALGVGDSDKLVLTVARFAAQKGLDLIIEAAATVAQTIPDAKFALVGDGAEFGAIREQVAARQLGDKVILPGHRDDVPDLLAAADLFVLPSRFEGLSLALLEAAAADLPIVATATAGNIEVLGSDHLFLVPPEDHEALARGIVAALSDADVAGHAAASALERFEQKFTSARMATQTNQIYQTLLSYARGAAA